MQKAGSTRDVFFFLRPSLSLQFWESVRVPWFCVFFAHVVLERLRAAHDGRREARPGTRWRGIRGFARDAVLRTSVVRLFARGARTSGGYVQQTGVVRGKTFPPHRVASIWMGWSRWVFTTHWKHPLESAQERSTLPRQFPEKWSCAVASVTAVNPMCARQDLEGVEYDLDEPRIAPLKHTWKAYHNTVYWCNLKLAQRRGLQFYQTRSHAITLSSTLPLICIEKVVCMKTGEELHCKVYRSRRPRRLTLVPNSQHDQKDVPITTSRKSDDCENEVNTQRGTCSSSRVDFRIPGIPHSTVEKVDESKKSSTINRTIRKSLNWNMLLMDYQEIGGDQPRQSRIKGFDYWNGQYRDLRILRDLFEETVSRFRFILGNWYRILHMRKMHAAYGDETTTQQRQIWHIVWHLATLHVQTQTLCRHNTLNWFVTRSRVAQVVLSINSHSISCFAPCLTTCTAHLLFWHQLHLHRLHLLLPAQAQGWSRPESTAQIHEASEVTALWIHNLAQVMSPQGLSTTWPSLSKRLSTRLKRVRFNWLRTRGKNWKNDPFSLPYYQSLLSPTQDSTQSIAAPQEAVLDDE